MSEMELKANAMLAELRAQRDSALDRCVGMAGEIATLKARLDEIEKSSGQ